MKLDPRLHWPLSLTLASLMLLGTYICIADPQLHGQRETLDRLQTQARLRQDSLALAPLHGLVDKAMQNLPAPAEITARLHDRLADLPIIDPHYDLATPATIQLGDISLQGQRLSLSFQATSLNNVKTLIGSLPGLLPCHAQLASLSIDRTSDADKPLAVRADFQLLGTER